MDNESLQKLKLPLHLYFTLSMSASLFLEHTKHFYTCCSWNTLQMAFIFPTWSYRGAIRVFSLTPFAMYISPPHTQIFFLSSEGLSFMQELKFISSKAGLLIIHFFGRRVKFISNSWKLNIVLNIDFTHSINIY